MSSSRGRSLLLCAGLTFSSPGARAAGKGVETAVLHDYNVVIIDFDTLQEAKPLGLVFTKPGRDEAVEARFYSIKSFPEHFALWPAAVSRPRCRGP